MNKKTLYFLCSLLAGILAALLFYIEYRIIIEMNHFEEPVYFLPNHNIELKGITATLAHLANIVFAFIAVIITAVCYSKYRK
jgi:hypothetical protein